MDGNPLASIAACDASEMADLCAVMGVLIRLTRNQILTGKSILPSLRPFPFRESWDVAKVAGHTRWCLGWTPNE